MVRLVVPLMGGILLQHHCRLEWSVIFLSAAGFLVIVMGFSLLASRWKFFSGWLPGFSILILLLVIGATLTRINQAQRPVFSSEQQFFLGEITELPGKKARSVHTTLRVRRLRTDTGWIPAKAKLSAYFASTREARELLPGDHIMARAYIRPIQNYGNPGEFNYKTYMATHRIYHQVYLGRDAWQKTAQRGKKSLKARSNRLRYHLAEILAGGIGGKRPRAIASALLLGHRDLLTPQMKEQFSASGTMHILAISGLHVGIIYLIFSTGLSFMDRYRHGRPIKTLIVLSVLLAYAYLTGLSPSVARATLMFAILALGRLMKRHTSVYNNLACSAFILLVINPMLLFSISFQLSYAAVTAIIFYQPRIYRLFSLPPLPGKIWQWLSLALAAQIGAAPLVIHYFHTFPNYFWLSNLVALPLASLILILGMVYLITTPILPFLSEFIQPPLNIVLLGLSKIPGIIAQLPLSETSGLWLSPLQLLLLYSLILSLSGFILVKKIRLLKLALILSISLATFNIYTKWHKPQQLVIYNTGKISAINHLNGRHNILYLNGNKQTLKKIHRYMENHWLSHQAGEPVIKQLPGPPPNAPTLPVNQAHFIRAGHIRLAYFHGKTNFSRLRPAEKLKLDYIVLAGNANISGETLRRCFTFKKIILDSSCSYYYRQRWIKAFGQKDIPVYSIPEQGAFYKTWG